jgi:predicted aspartyl protease
LEAFLAGQGYEVVPLRRLATGHFAIDGTAGAIALTLILDTGASHTILDVRRAARFGLVLRQERGRATGLGVSDQPVASAVLRNVTVGPMQWDSLAVSVLDLAHVNQTLQQMRVAPVDGIMGADLLLRRQAIIDYGTTRLYVREGESVR